MEQEQKAMDFRQKVLQHYKIPLNEVEEKEGRIWFADQGCPCWKRVVRRNKHNAGGIYLPALLISIE